jgi:hypothetical protein
MKNNIKRYDVMPMTTAKEVRNCMTAQMASYNRLLFHLLNK